VAKKRGDIGAEDWIIFEKIMNMRGTMGTIDDMYDGRMPLAYLHFVNMMCLVVVIGAPIALTALVNSS
jgi:hypothetical protein